MKAYSALFGCFVFAWILAKLDPRPKSKVSLALLVPTLWAMIIGSRMVSEWINLNAPPQSAGAYADGSPLDRNVFIVLIVSAFVIVLRRRVSIGKIIQSNRWMFLFLGYCAISILWSDFPLVSFKRYFKEIGNFFMALVVLSEADPMEAIRTLGKWSAYLLMPLSIVLYKYFPDLGRSYGRWDGSLSVTGVTNNKNSLGVLCMICGVLLLSSLLSLWRNKLISKNKTRFIVQASIFALTIWLMITAHSATSIGCFIVASCILTVASFRNIRRNIKYYLLAAVFIVAALQLSGGLVALTAGSLGRDESLTGRTDVWSSVIKLVVNPIIGDGYSSFWLGERMQKLWREYSWHPIEAHDGYLEIYLDLGLVGVTLLAGVLLSSFKRVLDLFQKNFEYGSLLLAILVAGVIYNVTESAFRPGLLMYFVFMLAVARFPSSVKKRRLQTFVPVEPTLLTSGTPSLEDPELNRMKTKTPTFSSFIRESI